jgi:transcriptional regulator with XRE-family HTH domain
MPQNSLGTKLKKLRKEKKLTQSDVDKSLGFSDRYMSKIESGVKPSMTKLKELADFFNVPIEYLVSESDEPNTLSAVIRHKEILEIFVEVDQMDSEDRQIIAGVVKAFIMKNKMKNLLENQK